MQRTILSQWFLFLVPDLKILRLHIVALLCVSGALEFPFPFPFFSLYLSLSHLSVFAFSHSFLFFPLPVSFPFCRSISFTYTLLLPSYTTLSFLCYSQLIWTGHFCFFAGKQQSTLIVLIPFLFSPFPVYGSAACSSNHFLSFAELYRETHRTQQSL